MRRAEDFASVFAEDFVLLRAADLEEARVKAVAYGRSQEDQYDNVYGEQVPWTFEGLVHLNVALHDPGQEVNDLYRRHFTDDAYRALLGPIE